MKGRADVVIIGAGIIGAACAYYLCRAGLNVHLVERAFPASGTSRACDSLILLWDKLPGAEFAMGQASSALWLELAGSLEQEFEYSRAGTILLAEDEHGLADGYAKAEALVAAGVRAEKLDTAGLLALEPNLAPDLAGGVFFPDDAQVDARRATLALLAAAQQRGLTLHLNAAVTAIRLGPEGRIAGVATRTGDIATDIVVCAAGVWCGELLRAVGLDIPVKPRQGHVLVLAGSAGLIRHPVLEGAYVSTVQSAGTDLQVALVAEPTSSGAILLGSSRRFAGFDRSVSYSILGNIAARAIRFLPGLAGASVIRSYAGLRPWSPDHLPLVGPSGLPGLFLATGHEGAGIGLAPATGQLIAAWITGSKLPSFATEVRPDRFAGQSFQARAA